MAKLKTSKDFSRAHEDFVAAVYHGRRSPSSGAADTDKGDVKDHETLFECKMTRKSSIPKLVKDFEKVAYEAYEQGLDPAVALRYYLPDSPLANPRSGYVDLTVRLTGDDAERTRKLKESGNQA